MVHITTMKKVLKPDTSVQPPLKPVSLDRSVPSFPLMQKGLAATTWMLIVLAFFGGLLLLLEDALLPLFPHLPHAPVSAAPLLLMGTASLVFQRLLRPKPLDLLKAMLVSLAFLLWGIDQFLPLGWGATSLGDLVIVLYVLDLGWMMVSVLRARGHGLFWQEPEGGNTPPVLDMQAEPPSMRD